MTTYRQGQLEIAEGRDKADAFDHIPAIKIRLKNGSTNWLSISIEEYQNIKRLLINGEQEYTQEISVSWCIDDVLQQAENDGVTITEKEAGAVLEYCYRKHDANQGITWETLSFWIGHIIAEREA